MRWLRKSIKARAFERRVKRMQRRALSQPKACSMAERLIGLERFDEAEAILDTALAAWPGTFGLLFQYAMSAHQRGLHEVALARWEDVRRADPDNPMGWSGVSANLRELGRIWDSEKTIREALRLFPEDLYVAGEAAYVFDRIGNQVEAAEQWRRLMVIEPIHETWYQGLAFSLIQTGRLDEARELLDRARAQYPEDRNLMSTEGYLEMARENWNGALAIWRAYRALYPDDRTGWDGQGKTLAAIQLLRVESDQPDDEAVKIEIELVHEDATRALMLGFESIGADCEFGLVQRRFVAEPLGLLRFNNVQLQSLMSALEAGFARMGEPDVTSMIISNSGEFYVTDTRWGLGMHTFQFSSQYEMQALMPKMCRRVAFLRDKMINDLRAAEKVFVFKSDAIDLDRLRELHRRLRAYGPVRLLHVRQASVPLTDEPVPVAAGEVYRIEPDLWVGFLSQMGNAKPERWDIAFDEWVAICAGLDDAKPLPVIAQLVQALPSLEPIQDL